MQIQFTARHMELTNALKNHTQSKLQKLRKYMNLIMDVNVTLSVEKYRHRAEVTIKGKRRTVSAMEVSDDMYLSIDRVFDKIEKQLRRGKDRRVNMKRAVRPEEFSREQENSEVISASEIVENEIEDVIVESEVVESKPMTIEEALLQFELNDDNLFVFMNSRANHEFNVLYRREDGKLGLIRTKS